MVSTEEYFILRGLKCADSRRPLEYSAGEPRALAWVGLHMRRLLSFILLISILGLAMEHETSAGNKTEKATFAGGCFWCMEKPFEGLEGVLDVVSGYTGGSRKDPTYEEVSSGFTGHAEAVEVLYDPSKTSYEELLDVFWAQIDPTDARGQFVDKGSQYITAIFYHSPMQKELAEKSREKLAASGRFTKPIVTEIKPASVFYNAEPYHQDYHKTCPAAYSRYRTGSGRDSFLKKIWGSVNGPSKDALKKQLTPIQYRVTQECGTEKPFDNEYWDNKKDGIYVDIVSGEALFSSIDKFDSGTGWPSFTRPLETGNITEEKDKSLFMERTEVRSKNAGSHLGHVFSDGPSETGLRYCINSASLRFIKKEDLEKEGYGKYKYLFEK